MKKRDDFRNEITSLSEIDPMVFFDGEYENKELWEKTYINAKGYFSYLTDVVKNKLNQYTIQSLAEQSIAYFGKKIPLFVLSYNISKYDLLNRSMGDFLRDSYGVEIFARIDSYSYKDKRIVADDVLFLSDKTLSSYPERPKAENEIQLLDFVLGLIAEIELQDEMEAFNSNLRKLKSGLISDPFK